MVAQKIEVTEEKGRGYHSLAGCMAWLPRFAIFPRFKMLNMLNLLLMHAELAKKEEILRQWVSMDEQPGDTCRIEVSQDIDAFLDLDEDDPRRMVTQELRKLLADYNMALCHQIQIYNQRSPYAMSLKELRAWLRDPRCGNTELSGPGSDTWFESEKGGRGLDDLVSLSPISEEVSGMAVWLAPGLTKVLTLLPRQLISISEYGTGGAMRRIGSAQTWLSVGDQVTTILAAILILVPVIALHFVNNPDARLGMIVAFTLVFVFVMSLTTGASRNEVFAATAAFVAVQVVYVGSAINSDDQSSASNQNATISKF